MEEEEQSQNYSKIDKQVEFKNYQNIPQIQKLNHKNLYEKDQSKSQSNISQSNDISRQDPIEKQFTENDDRFKIGGFTNKDQPLIRGMKS